MRLLEYLDAMKKLLFLSLAVLALSTGLGLAQTSTTGAIAGSVTDSTGAALPGAKVTVTNPGTGAKLTVTANASGHFSASLLQPGVYTVSAVASNFESDTFNVNVGLGSTTSQDISMVAAGDKTTVEVNAATVPLLDTQNIALVTTLTEEQIQDLPAPGGDVTTVAFTLPGVVVNAGGSYGNFSSDGLPGISNLFVLNGFDNQDPFLNLNNSGSSNLTLGQGELKETSVVQNAYNSQYGRAAGAIINYTTKTGTNSFHGEADYYNNASIMNANGWFGNYDGIPRPHAVSNQWAVNVGGPIWRDKAFFFADYEGLRYVLPGAAGLVNFPSPQLQAYALANVPASALSLYKQAFAAYKTAPSYASAVPVTTGNGPAQDATGSLGCGSFTAAAPGGGTFGTTVPCLTIGAGSANNVNKEWLFTIRGDVKISDRQDVYARFKVDHGSQPTYTNFINPLFNAVSIQPENEGQFNDNFRITPNMVNSFTMAGNWYSAYFGPASNAASAGLYPDFLLPDIGFDGSGVNNSSGLATLGVPGALTQGRDVTQYQLVDDFSYLRGRHTIKAGFNFRRDDITDYDPQVNTVFPQVVFFSLGDYVSGIVSPANAAANFGAPDSFSQSFTSIQHAHIALYNIGVYGQDEFQIKSNLKLTAGARIDRTGNPLCNDNCFSLYKQGAFPATGASLTAAYDAAAGGPISNTNAHPFGSVQPLNFQARFGFNYSPRKDTEIRGGVGMFSDLYPATFLDGVIGNFPNINSITVYSGVNGAGGAGTLVNDAAAANTALVNGFKTGQSITQINTVLTNQGVPFTPPSLGAYFPSEFKVPEYLEYSLQLQHQIGRDYAVIITYAGNHGYNLLLTNPYQNAAAGIYDNTSGTYSESAGPFGGLPNTPPDPRFSRVTAFTNNGISNYDGLQSTLKHTGHGFTGQVSYTYSHARDTISNGGAGLGWNGLSVTNQVTPSLATQNLNYSNADYDVRHNVVGDLTYEAPSKLNTRVENVLGAGWTLGVKSYARTGEPYSVVNSATLGSFYNLGTTLMPDKLVTTLTDTCGSNPHGAVANPCLQSTDYVATGTTQTDFGTIRRNTFRGPHYFNTDFSVTKALLKTERFKFVLGGNAYNLWNHPNFGSPNNVIGTGTFGEIANTLAPPTSPYGSFQGAQVTQRVIQVHGRFTF